jgi:hypothetical protein
VPHIIFTFVIYLYEKNNEHYQKLAHITALELNNANDHLMREVTERKAAQTKGLVVSEFTREMIETTDDRKVIELTRQKSSSEVEYLGVLVFGKKSEVELLTKQFPLQA